MLYGIMGEDRSDVNTLKVLIRRLAQEYSLSAPAFHAKGYDGWSEMFRKGVAQTKLFADLGCHKIVICYDADGPQQKAAERREKICREIIEPADVSARCFDLVPVQELEAWILAHIAAVNKVFKSWKPKQVYDNPERIPSPKEFLIKLSRISRNQKARYRPPCHNPLVAEHLQLRTVEKKCPSFERFVEFVTGMDRATRHKRFRNRASDSRRKN